MDTDERRFKMAVYRAYAAGAPHPHLFETLKPQMDTDEHR
jgi:hypothetical protein